MYPSIEVDDFLTRDEVSEITRNYNELEKLILEDFFEEEPDNSKITCLHVMDWDKNSISYITRITGDKRFIGHGGEASDDDFKLFMALIDTDWIQDTKDLLARRLNQIQRGSSDVITISFFDFFLPFETHSDGFDLSEEIKSSRRSPEIDLIVEEMKKNASYNFLHQGLINIDADPNHGTIIFDQWYPMSVYCDYSMDNTKRWSTGWGPYKETIQFYKGDEPERYGEHIRNFTHEYMNIEDYNKISEFDKIHFPYEASYGLSLEKELLFGQPGKLISWDGKKFHKPKPFPRVSYKEGLQRNRLCLQYEVIKKL